MKKKFLTLLLALMVALALTVPAWAEQQPGDAFVYDMAGLLSEEDDAYLEALASQISWEHNCAVYIVTMEDHQEYDSDIHYAVVSFYDSNSLGIGENREGILLMLSMYDRSYDLYVRDGVIYLLDSGNNRIVRRGKAHAGGNVFIAAARKLFGGSCLGTHLISLHIRLLTGALRHNGLQDHPHSFRGLR